MNKILVLLLAITTLLGYVYVLFLPEYQKLKEIQQELKKAQEDFVKTDRYLFQLKKTVSKLEEFEEEFKKIESAFPIKSDAANILNFLNDKSRESGLILKQVTESPMVELQKENVEEISDSETGAASTELKKISVGVELDGSYQSFFNFLKEEIERSERLIRVENFSLTPIKQGEEILKIKLKISVYLWPEKNK